MAERRRRLVREKCRFFDFNWLTWERPLRNQKKLNELNKPLHPSTNPENLVKIGPLGSELPRLESRPLKNNKNEEKTLAKYIALPASLPSGLKIKCTDMYY